VAAELPKPNEGVGWSEGDRVGQLLRGTGFYSSPCDPIPPALPDLLKAALPGCTS